MKNMWKIWFERYDSDGNSLGYINMFPLSFRTRSNAVKNARIHFDIRRAYGDNVKWIVSKTEPNEGEINGIDIS